MTAGGADLRAIDVHAHVIPQSFPDYVGTPPPEWPSMAPAGCGHANVMIGGKVFRKVSAAGWDVERRLDDMARRSIRMQALSPMPDLLSYWMEPHATATLARFINGEIAEMVRRAPERFVGLGGVPLQQVDLAIAELEHAVKELGLAGVEIGSNVNSVPLGDPQFDAFFAAAQELGAAVFVHALKPVVGRERLEGLRDLVPIVGFPGEVGLAVVSFLASDVTGRFPRLRVAFSHGGGSFPMLLPRWQQAWSVTPQLQEAMADGPVARARTCYFDTLVFEAATLRYLIEILGPDRLLIGTDYPFRMQDERPVARIDELGLPAELRAQLLHANAEAFLALG